MAKTPASQRAHNKWVRSMQMDEVSWKMADRIMEETGLSFSMMIRVMIHKAHENMFAELDKEQENAKAEQEERNRLRRISIKGS